MTPSTGRPWRPAPVLVSLRLEIDRGWPRRSTASDGFIGDQLHKARKSQHNPNEYGDVCAWDVTHDAQHGPPLDLLAAFLRDVGASGSQRFALGGYVIYDRKIVSERSDWIWRPYKGDDPHVGHLHLSCSGFKPFYDITRPWHVVEAIRQRSQRAR